jgi:Predicted ATP-dependent Lon-type protease
VYLISRGASDTIEPCKLEVRALPCNGKLVRTGVATHSDVRDAINIAWNYFQSNSSRVRGSISLDTRDYLLHVAASKAQWIRMTCF